MEAFPELRFIEGRQLHLGPQMPAGVRPGVQGQEILNLRDRNRAKSSVLQTQEQHLHPEAGWGQWVYLGGYLGSLEGVTLSTSSPEACREKKLQLGNRKTVGHRPWAGRWDVPLGPNMAE